MSDWATIETAPKDGTKIIVWTVHGEYEMTSWFHLEHDVYEETDSGLYRKRRQCYAEGWNGNIPVLWQPLPPPPEQSQ